MTGMAGMDAVQGSPPKERYGTYTNADRAEIAVQVKAADFNGSSFDGRPFSTMPKWLLDAIMANVITPNTRRHTDYADWDVVTCRGTLTARPGDWIILREYGDLSVIEEEDAHILINLRPPVESDGPDEISQTP